jgi:hypothetical protein
MNQTLRFEMQQNESMIIVANQIQKRVVGDGHFEIQCISYLDREITDCFDKSIHDRKG